MSDWRALVVLRVSGKSVDPDGLLNHYPLPGATVWRRGEKRPRRGVHEYGGFAATIVDADSQAAVHRALDRHLNDYAGLYSEVARLGEHAFVDIGLMVPATHPLSLTLEPELLHALLDSHIVITVSAYPCSDEPAAQQEDEADKATRR
jgi:hypothetical protein